MPIFRSSSRSRRSRSPVVILLSLCASGCDDTPAAPPQPTVDEALAQLAASPDEPPNGIRAAADLWHLGRREEALERFLATRGEADRRVTSFDDDALRLLPALERAVTEARIQLRITATIGLLRELGRRADASADAGERARLREAIAEAIAAQRSLGEGMAVAFEQFER
jgi:hypothetical protein